jgi:50S ribosomal protein L16 3-hydroxylase
MSDAARRALLGGLTPSAFLRRHWQKEALMIAAAMPGFRGLMPPSQLFALAARDDVESRLVIRDGRTWSLINGPISRAQIRSLPPRAWTLLVQGVNLHHAAGDALLRRFAFIPYARLDDLMVSYAAPGGGVGPHFDSYDVFLLQGEGRRRWRISRQRDLALRPSMPLKILARFKAREAWTLGPGDMLYLPPNYAHDGVALDTCTTYSIGFRAPSANELATAFVDWLRDMINIEGRYADPSLKATLEPARIAASMRRRCASMIGRIRWSEDDVARFLGGYLSEPKPHVVFSPPPLRKSPRRFADLARRRGLHLDWRTLLLYDEDRLYINGSLHPWPRSGAATIKRLADARGLAAADVGRGAANDLLHQWYCDGFLHLD